MTATLESVWSAASLLSAKERGHLAEQLFATVDDTDAEAEDFGLDATTWEKIDRRLDRLDAGTAVLIPGDEGLRRGRAKLAAMHSA